MKSGAYQEWHESPWFVLWLDLHHNPATHRNTHLKYMNNDKEKNTPADAVDKDSLGQNEAWPGEKLIVPPKKIAGENGEVTIVPVVR
jgi:hypothetical protein